LKRLITKRQEQILRLCHHDHEGLTQVEAAQRLNVSQSTISNTLKRIEEVMPDFFPILSKLEAKCYHYFTVEGWSISEITEYLGQSENAIYKALKRAKDKGAWFSKSKGRILSYNPNMDAHVRKTF